MLTQLPQLFHRQSLLLEELEHRRSAIVTREVVRRSRKPRRPWAILHPSTRCLTEIGELTEPPGRHRSQRRIGRETQERVAGAKLAILIAATHHRRAL